MTFSDNATVKFHLNDHKEKVTMEEAIREIKPEGGITNTHLALRVSLTIFSLYFWTHYLLTIRIK